MIDEVMGPWRLGLPHVLHDGSLIGAYDLLGYDVYSLAVMTS